MRLVLKSGKEIELNQAFNIDCLDFMKTLPDGCIGLLMVDPPYFEVKGDFDFIWPSFDAYLQDVEKWAIECKRILANNGSLFWWGHAKKIAYSQTILDKYFNLENSIVWEKIDTQVNKNKSESMRSFKPVTERVLFYSNEVNRTGLEEIKLDVNKFKTMRDYFKNVQEFTGCNKKEIIEEVGQSADHPFRWGSSQWDMPTAETYFLLTKIFNINCMVGYKEYEELRREYEELRREYEELRREYEELRRPFNLGFYNFTDVIKASQEANISGQYDHDTIKPLGLIKKLIQTTTRKDTLVYIPFWGSGTDSEACHELGLNWLATETDEKHFKNASNRQKEKERQPLMEFS